VVDGADRTVYSGVAIAGLLGSLIGGLVGLPASGSPAPSSSSGAAPPATVAQWHRMGHTHAPSGKLRGGCRNHRYTYTVTPPPQTWWTLEIFIVGPKKARLASDVIISGADKTTGSKRFQLCRVNTRPGRFLIKGRLTYKDYPDEYDGWIQPSHFTLRKP